MKQILISNYLFLLVFVILSFSISAQNGIEIAAGGGLSSCNYWEDGTFFQENGYLKPEYRSSYFLGIGYKVNPKPSKYLSWIFQGRIESKGMDGNFVSKLLPPDDENDNFKVPLIYLTARAEANYNVYRGIFAGASVQYGYYVNDLKSEYVKNILNNSQLGNYRNDVAGGILLGYTRGRVRVYTEYNMSMIPAGKNYGGLSPEEKLSGPVFTYTNYFFHLGVAYTVNMKSE